MSHTPTDLPMDVDGWESTAPNFESSDTPRSRVPGWESPDFYNEPVITQSTPSPGPANPDSDQLQFTTPNKRRPGKPQAKLTSTERCYVRLAIVAAARDHDHWLDPHNPNKHFGEKFCDQVREILHNDPLIGGAVRQSPKCANGKSPNDRTIRDIWVDFRTRGVPEPKIPSSKSKDDAKRDAILRLQKEGDELSVREIARRTETSKWLVQETLKSEDRQNFYRAPRGQNLKKSDCTRRMEFARKTHDLIEWGSFDPRNCAFSDEANGSPNANRRNFGYWRPKGQFHDWQEKMVTRKCFEEKVHTFVLVHWKIGALGPYFIEDIPQQPNDDGSLQNTPNLNSKRYLYLLKHHVIPDLEAALGPEDFAKCWWQQDGAPAHSTREVLNFLFSKFGHRIFSNSRDPEIKMRQSDWPAYSPDLNPLDYFYWSELRKKLYQRKASGKAQIKTGIEDIVRTGIPLTMIQRAIDNFRVRVEACLDCNGAHFEYHLKSFKVKRNIAKESECDACGESHACPCDSCKDRCHMRRLIRADEAAQAQYSGRVDWENPYGMNDWFTEDNINDYIDEYSSDSD